MNLRDREGLEALYLACYPRLVAELSLVTGSRASGEDCANEAFTRLVKHWNKVSTYERPVAWVRTVGYRLAVDELRRRARHTPLLDYEVRAGGAVPDGTSQYEIWEAIQHLPIDQREVLIRHASHGLSDSEIAAHLDVPIGTVKSRLSRARRSLRSRLGDAS